MTVLWAVPFTLMAYALAPTLWVSAIAIFAVGLVYLGALSSFMSIGQMRAPAQVRGRVMSLLTMSLGALYPLGAIMQGALADHFGLRTITLLAGASMLLSLAMLRLFRPGLEAALDAPIEPYESQFNLK